MSSVLVRAELTPAERQAAKVAAATAGVSVQRWIADAIRAALANQTGGSK